MIDNYTNSFILNSLDLPVIKDIETLSWSLSLSKNLIYILSSQTENFYKKFFIKKRNGNEREILSPSYSLRLVQRWILKEILEKIKTTNQSMAFKKGKEFGIKKNASYHRYSLYILEMDIKDFFTSIKDEKVFFLFKNVGYNNLISNVLKKLCTFDGYLPQGAITSPYISNLLCYKLDKRLNGLCGNLGVIYTRYADDLTFSCDNKHILNRIKKIISQILCDEGFELNIKKTRILSPKSHKIVTGLTVNDNRIKASKKLKRKVRSMIHHDIVSGNYSNINQIRGIVAYVNSIEGGYKEKIIKYINNLINKNKDYIYYKELVDMFNENKIFGKVAYMKYCDPRAIEARDGDEYTYYNSEEFICERKEFICKNKINDIVNYSKWII